MTAAVVSAVAAGSASASAGDTSDHSPVDLSTPVDMAAGQARPAATIVAGDARFEVLRSDVIRLEYSPTHRFLDGPTFNVLDRDFPVPAYRVTRRDGWLTITTDDMRVRYRLRSGPFSAINTRVALLGPTADGSSRATPAWEWECTFGQVCQSGAASLSGTMSLATNHTGYVSPAGFLAGYTATGNGATWRVLGAPAGAATLSIRYANNVGALGGPAPRTVTVVVDGHASQVTLAPTASWDTWATTTIPVTLSHGTDSVAVECASGDSCNVNVDDVSLTRPGATAAPVLPADGLGGWLRSFDSANGTYSASPSCTGAETDATCEAPIPATAQGLLDGAGWYLLDDTQTATWTSSGWVTPRAAGADVEDGYLFGYDEDYRAALASLRALTGPTTLPPEYLFGNWFSRYYPYTTADYEDELLPQFAANDVSLDTLSVDTDWKNPSTWDGWNWNPSLFPDPTAFLQWAAARDLHVTLNVHSSISQDDPQLAKAEAIAGNDLSCSGGECFWDWSTIVQAESNFALQQPFVDQGVSFWWLDWCCDASEVSMPGLTPDSWINHLYAQQLTDAGQRGFVLARIGASYQDENAGAYAAGPWAEHRSTVHFTGDTWSTWNTLAEEAQLSQDEGSIGQPYVSDDIGGFLGPPSGSANDPDDLYLRWLALGTFQPIMREHSNAGQNARLPWEYDAATQADGDAFLQLRESLVPYLYSVAAHAAASGLPMTRALYLDDPGQPQAYDHPTEYTLGSQMLVAPVTTPGAVSRVSVWMPPGRWTDWFTGATFTGPSTQTLEVPLDRAPVFVRDGGIISLQPSAGHAQTAGSAPITLRVFAGGDGHSEMYDDAGSGLGYEHGQSTETPLSDSSGPRSTSVRIGSARGAYAGQPASRDYAVQLVDVTTPRLVLVDGRPLAPSRWSYDSPTRTLTVDVGAVATDASATVTQIGGSAVSRPEPAATSLTLDPADAIVSASAASTRVSETFTDSGPGAVSDVHLSLTAPAGWTVSPLTATSAATVAAGASLTASWSVTAPAGSGPQTATLSGSSTDVDDATGATQTDTAQQLAVPVIDAVSPTTAAAGQTVTISGADFGATQGDSYVTFSDDGTNWGAPPDLATFDVTSWSDDRITFVVPTPSGSGGTFHVVPGSIATVTVTTADGTSQSAQVAISSG